MKNKISFVVTLLTMIMIPGIAQAYDFSAVSPSGHTLYYNIVNGSARVINVSGNENSYRVGGYLSGDLIIPDTVYYSGYPIAVGSIGSYAFAACNITSVTIPKTVTLVRQFVFYQCNSLKTVNYTGTISQWCSITFEHDQSNPLVQAKKLYINGEPVIDVNITAGITEIKPYAFYSSDIHSVSIPNTVTTIGENAFADCFKLQPVTIPSSVSTIGYRAFGNVPMVFYYGTLSGAPWGARFRNGYVEDSLYYTNNAKTTIIGCMPGKKNVVIPNTVTTIYNMAFYCYDETKSVTIPSSVTTIQSMAFYNCESLSPLTIPNSVTSIGSNAFYNVHMIYYQGTASGRPWGALAMNGYEENGLYYTSSAKDSLVYVSPAITSVTIPSSVIYIGDNAIPLNNNIDTLHLNTFMFNGFASSRYNMDSVSVLFVGANPFWPSAFTTGNPNIITIHVEAPRTSIPSNAFKGSSNLTTVTLPNTITSIGDCSFEGCMGLNSIIIPNSVTTIGGGVFRNCRNLISVTLPNSITSFGYEAFRGCLSLTSFTIPSSVTSMGYHTFYGAKIDTLYYNADSINVTYDNRPCFDSVRVVFIGSNVRIWNEYLFKGCVGINSAHIGDSISAIPSNAFNGCSNLSSVAIPNSVTQIGYGAFANCSSLLSMTIPDSVTTMGASVFENCSNLSSVIIGNSVTAIGYQSFYNCSSLSSVTIGSSVASIGYRAFCNCSNLSSVTIPNSVNLIENSVFRDCISLSFVTIPNSVTSLGSYVFYNCSSLSSVVIGDSVTTIKNHSFYGDSNLRVIRLGHSVNTIESAAFTGTKIDTLYFEVDSMGDFQNYNYPGWDSIHVVIIGDHVRTIPAYAFYNCKNLSSVTIPNSVNSIREAAFQNCSNLSSVILGDSVAVIGHYSFYGDSNLTVLRLGRSINTIGNGAFTGTRIDTLYYDIENINLSSSHHLWDSVRVVYLGYNVRIWPTYLLRGLHRLNTVVIGDSITAIPYDAMYGCIDLTSITISNSVTSIGYDAFRGCSSLVYVEIPNSVTSIGSGAFQDCISLTSVSLPNSITSIGYSTFGGCSSLASITIPNSVTSIDGHAFHGCSSLSSVTIPNSVASIGDDAFHGCTSLTSVMIPNSVITIDYYAFSGCTNLVSVSLPEHITSISSGLFSGCSSLASIHIPDSVTNIGANAFNGCASLTSISLGKNLRSLNNNTYNCYNSCFGGCVSLDTLYYDCDSLGKYHLTSSYGFDSVGVVYVGPNVRYWPSQLFSGRQKLREATINVSKTPIADGAFSSCHNLSKVTILDSVKVIGYSAFSNCDSLKFVYISDSVDSIATGAFAYCTNLEEIVLPQSITSIERDLFAECTSLRSIVIPDSVTSIGYYAFYNCVNLTTVSLGKKLQSIEYQFWPSFEGCSSIDTLYINCDSINCFPLWSSRIGFDSISVAYVGSNVRYWPINLFRNYRRLRSVIIDTGVSYIGSRAFDGCTSLENVEIPNSVTYIDSYAFFGCTGLLGVEIPNSVNNIGLGVFNNCVSLTSMIIPNSVTYLGSGAFNNCTSLVSVTLPDSLTTIEYSTFNNCNSLTSITMPNSVTAIGSHSFFGCSSLESITIPSQITTIATATFSGCSSLDSVSIPNSVHTIENYAFYNCSSLTDLEMGDSLITIDDYAFDYCNNLGSVTIPNSVTYIGSNAFQHCGNMSSLTLGNSLSTIGDSAFYNCTGLVSVTALSEYPPLVSNNSHDLFADTVLNNAVLTVPCSTVYDYYIDPVWGLFDTISGFGDGYVEWMCYDTACGSYTWINGQTYTYNTYGATFYQEAVGVCDTMYNLLLTIHPTYSRTVLLEACDNMLPYNYADTLLQGAGLYNIMFESQYGCDSLIRLDFRIKPTYETYDNLVLCQSMLPYYSQEYDTIFNDGVGQRSYEFMRQGINGCDSLVTLQVTVHPSENTEICMVTVENEHNNVIWNRGANVSGYNIYREGLTANQYDLVATIMADTMMSSTWIDTDSDPVARSYRYRIASVDQCDIESDWSPVHKTMHLTINQGIGNTWNLVWSEYEGAVYSTYQIYRGTNASDLELIDEMPSNNTSYTDQNVEQSTVYYQVAIVKDEPCYNTKSTNIIRSNFATSNYEGIQVAGNIIVSVYPNPANKMITVDADSYIKKVDLLDMTGRCLKTLGADGLIMNISLDEFSSGIYMLRVTTDKGTAVHKIAVE